MKPVPFEGQNRVYVAPLNWNEATMGECCDLPVRQEPGSITSCYELSQSDIEKIENGANLYFTIFQDRQPVVGWEIK